MNLDWIYLTKECNPKGILRMEYPKVMAINKHGLPKIGWLVKTINIKNLTDKEANARGDFYLLGEDSAVLLTHVLAYIHYGDLVEDAVKSLNTNKTTLQK